MSLDIYCKRLNGQNLDQNEIIKGISSRNIGSYYFPQVVEFKELQNQKARHCEKLLSISKLDSLGMVAVKPIEFQIKLETPFIDLATPIHYKLNSYKQLTHNNYVARHENRLLKLRTGAEDELTQITTDIVPQPPSLATQTPISTKISANIQSRDIGLMSSQQTQRNLKSGTTAIYDKLSSVSNVNNDNQKVSTTTIIDLKPSKKLAIPVDYSPLHIFVRFLNLMLFLLYKVDL